MRQELPYGKNSLSVDIPDGFSFELVTPGEPQMTLDPGSLIQKALQNPIGRDRLGDIVQPGDTVSIIVSDITRPVQTATMLRPLLQTLLEANIQKEHISIVFGLGIHRSMTEEERIEIVGIDIYQQYRCIDHDIEHCRFMGTTSRNTPVEIFEGVAGSDIIICTGSIQHHYFAGYTGGYKALLPGVASRRSIEANHALMIHEGTAPGNVDCPVRADLEEGGTIAGVDFILNVILDGRKNIVGAVAGHPTNAHRAGVEIVDKIFKKDVEPADVVIVSAGGWPKDLNLFQSHKAMEHVKSAVRPGGAIILVACCDEGLGNRVYEEWLDTTSGPEEAIRRFNQGFIQGGHKAALIGKLALEYELYLVSGLTAAIARKAYFTTASSLQEAFDSAIAKCGPNAHVIIAPHGSSTLLCGK